MESVSNEIKCKCLNEYAYHLHFFFLSPADVSVEWSLWNWGLVEDHRAWSNDIFQLRMEPVGTHTYIHISTNTHTHTHMPHCWVCASISSFDFSVTVFAFLGLIALAFDMEPFYFIVVLRPLQLLRCVYLFLCFDVFWFAYSCSYSFDFCSPRSVRLNWKPEIQNQKPNSNLSINKNVLGLTFLCIQLSLKLLSW